MSVRVVVVFSSKAKKNQHFKKILCSAAQAPSELLSIEKKSKNDFRLWGKQHNFSKLHFFQILEHYGTKYILTFKSSITQIFTPPRLYIFDSIDYNWSPKDMSKTKNMKLLQRRPWKVNKYYVNKKMDLKQFVCLPGWEAKVKRPLQSSANWASSSV